MTAPVRRPVEFTPGYDKRTEGYGVHGMSIRFLAVGEAGAVQFVMNTGWVPGLPARPAGLYPYAVDLGYHWPTSRYEGMSRFEDCDVLGDGGCFYDGSGLNAEPVMQAFIRDGEPAVWAALENYYADLVARSS